MHLAILTDCLSDGHRQAGHWARLGWAGLLCHAYDKCHRILPFVGGQRPGLGILLGRAPGNTASLQPNTRSGTASISMSAANVDFPMVSSRCSGPTSDSCRPRADRPLHVEMANIAVPHLCPSRSLLKRAILCDRAACCASGRSLF